MEAEEGAEAEAEEGAEAANVEPEILSYEEFALALGVDVIAATGRSGSGGGGGGGGRVDPPWTLAEDEAIASLVGAVADKEGLDPLRIRATDLERAFNAGTGNVGAGAVAAGGAVLRRRSFRGVQARYAALCVLNKAALLALPLTDVGRKDWPGKTPLVATALPRFRPFQAFASVVGALPAATAVDADADAGTTVAAAAAAAGTELSGREYCAVKRAVFTRSKLLGLWLPALRETTTPTGAPPDEYERPDDLREININRLEARNTAAAASALPSDAASAMSSSSSSAVTTVEVATSIVSAAAAAAAGADFSAIPFSERLRMSVFGQLVDGIRHWDDRSLRRSFVHMQDAGQARAFFVKFTGEGVDDHGGPYRAALHAAAGEEPQGLLGLLTPCMNAKTDTGDNREQTVFNPEYLAMPDRLPLYAHLGKLVALACRHNVMVPLALPDLLWRPLVGEAVGLPALQATDAHTARSLLAIMGRAGEGSDALGGGGSRGGGDGEGGGGKAKGGCC
jgi:hypothetical protein